MAYEDSVEQLKTLQGRVKKIASNRDEIIQKSGVEKRRLEEAYERLRELGIENPEELTAKQLRAKVEELETDLQDKITTLTEEVEHGEALMTEYQKLQEA